MRNKSILTYSGKLSTDTDRRYVKPENHIAANNVYGTPKENGGTLFTAPGAVQVATDLTSAQTLIGTFEEKTTNKIYYLVYFAGAPDRIYVYDPLDQTASNGVSRELCRFTGLDLNSQYLAQGKIVGGKYLVWTESNMIKNTLDGNGIKKINLERADVNKRFTYKIAVTQVSAATEDHFYQFYDVNGTAVGSAVKFYDPPSPEADIQTRLNNIASSLNAVSGIGAVAYKNYVLVTMDTAGQRLQVYTDIPTVQDGLTDWPDAKYNGVDLIFWAENHYPLDATRNMFDLCKRPYPCAPYHEFQENPDPLDKYADLKDGAWQFIIRIHYADFETSAWSEPSIIASNMATEEQELSVHSPGDVWLAMRPQELQNIIRLRYHNDLLTTEAELALIDSVEIAVRKGKDQPFYQLEKVSIEDAITNKFELEFRNDRLGPAVASDDNFTDPELQVLKKQDWVPRDTGSIGLIAEETGNAKIVLGSPLEGYDNIDKANATYEFIESADYDTDRKLHHRLKEHGEYRVGIEYLDDFGRISDVEPLFLMSVPTHADPSTVFDFKALIPRITINHYAPTWATKYRIVRTKDLKHSDFFQFATYRFVGGEDSQINDWLYVQESTQDANSFDIVDFDVATKILIRLPYDMDNTETGEIQYFEERARTQYFTPEDGDKMRITKVMRPTNIGQYTYFGANDLDILGIYTNEDGRRYLVLDKFTDGTEADVPLKGIYIIEVYRPNNVDDKVYSETSNCFDIATVGQKRVHLANNQDQTATDPAVIDLYGGDVMWIGQNVLRGVISKGPFSSFDSAFTRQYHNIESRYFSFTAKNLANSLGRGNLEDSLKEEYVFNRFRYSQIYLPNSKINGINSFRASDYIDINEEFGPISGLEMSGNTLMAVCFNKLQPIYLNRQDILNVNNAGLLGTSNKAFAMASELRGDHGCQHKESILSQDGKIYGWDKRTGVLWRYDVNGVNDIRTDVVTTFSEIGEYRKSFLIYLDRVFTGYDRRRNLFFIFFPEINRDGINSLWIFNEDTNGWIGNLDMTPQMMNAVNDKLLSWKENQLYVHDGIGHVPANYHGVQTVPSVTKVFNENPTAIKIPWAATTQSRFVWDFPEISSPPSRHYATGQASRIRSENWRNVSGKWSAAFLRDMNDTKAEFLEIPNLTTRAKTALLRGRHLRGDHFVITLRMPIPDHDTLLSTEIEYTTDKKE